MNRKLWKNSVSNVIEKYEAIKPVSEKLLTKKFN